MTKHFPRIESNLISSRTSVQKTSRSRNFLVGTWNVSTGLEKRVWFCKLMVNCSFYEHLNFSFVSNIVMQYIPEKLINCHHPNSVWKVWVRSVYLFNQKYFWLSARHFFVGHIDEITNMILLLVKHCRTFPWDTLWIFPFFIFYFLRSFICLPLTIEFNYAKYA